MNATILIIEDNPDRIAWISQRLPRQAVRTILARSAGAALGILQRDGRHAIDGVMLDHDLHESTRTDADMRLSGSHVIAAICRHLPRRVPILIHSMNATDAAGMSQRLRTAGFPVSRCPMTDLTDALLSTWVDEVLDDWDD